MLSNVLLIQENSGDKSCRISAATMKAIERRKKISYLLQIFSESSTTK